MAKDWRDDEQLLAELGEAVREGQDVPARFVEAGKAAFAWRDVDADLAALQFDSATSPVLAMTRSEQAELRAMTFVAGRLTIELEVAPDALLGQLVPPQAGEVDLHRSGGATSTTAVDDVGWFAIRPLPSGLVRLRVRAADGEVVVTEWVRL